MGFHVGLCLSFDLGSKAIVRRILLYYTTSKIVSFKTKVPWFVIFRFLPLVQIVSHNTENGVIPCNMPNWFWKRVFYTDHLRVQSINSPALTLICAKPFYTSTMENYCYEVCLGKKCWFLIRDERTFSPLSKSWFPKSCKRESIFEHDIQSAEARHFPAVWRMQRRASQNRLRCSQHKHNFPLWINYFIAAPFALMHYFEGIFKLLLTHYSPC